MIYNHKTNPRFFIMVILNDYSKLKISSSCGEGAKAKEKRSGEYEKVL